MQKDPDEPSDESAHAKPAAFQTGKFLAEDGHIAPVEVSEWMFWLPAPQLSRDQAPDIASLLDRRLRHTGHRPAIAHDRCGIACDEHATDVWDVHEWADRYPARPICLRGGKLENRGRGDARG